MLTIEKQNIKRAVQQQAAMEIRLLSAPIIHRLRAVLSFWVKSVAGVQNENQ